MGVSESGVAEKLFPLPPRILVQRRAKIAGCPHEDPHTRKISQDAGEGTNYWSVKVTKKSSSLADFQRDSIDAFSFLC